jgi:hypothetical protein
MIYTLKNMQNGKNIKMIEIKEKADCANIDPVML